jgi:hypothetical protein
LTPQVGREARSRLSYRGGSVQGDQPLPDNLRACRSDDLDDAVNTFLALALVDTGHERVAVSVALTALSRHLTRYQRSLANYARLLAGNPT